MLKFKRIAYPCYFCSGKHKDILVISQDGDSLLQVEIRLDGFLMDLITVAPNRLRIYPLYHITKEVEITIVDIKQGLDMTLDENITFRNFNFFNFFKKLK